MLVVGDLHRTAPGQAADAYTKGSGMSQLEGKRILITGSTRGIGFGMAEKMAALGASLILTGRDQTAVDAAAAELASATGAKVAGLGAPLTDEDAVNGLVDRAAAIFGGIDVLVNNAGIDSDGPALDHALEDWRRVIHVNLEVPFRLAQQAARHFLSEGKGGVVINVASVAGFKAIDEASSYVASKHGLVGLTKVLALEWGRKNIRVCGIAPGLIKTDMTQYIWGNEAGQAYVNNKIPIGRIGLPSDIGALTAFLASEDAGFIHGETIIVDGGATID